MKLETAGRAEGRGQRRERTPPGIAQSSRDPPPSLEGALPCWLRICLRDFANDANGRARKNPTKASPHCSRNVDDHLALRPVRGTHQQTIGNDDRRPAHLPDICFSYALRAFSNAYGSSSTTDLNVPARSRISFALLVLPLNSPSLRYSAASRNSFVYSKRASAPSLSETQEGRTSFPAGSIKNLYSLGVPPKILGLTSLYTNPPITFTMLQSPVICAAPAISRHLPCGLRNLGLAWYSSAIPTVSKMRSKGVEA